MCTHLAVGVVSSEHSITCAASAQVLRRLEALLEEERAPADDADLVLLTRALQLACACRAQLRARRYAFPAPDPQLLRGFYPLLSGCMLEVQLRDEDDPARAHAPCLCLGVLPIPSCMEGVVPVIRAAGCARCWHPLELRLCGCRGGDGHRCQPGGHAEQG